MGLRWQGWIAYCTVVLGIWGAQTQIAEAQQLRLLYEAPSACPDAEAFLDRLSSRIGRIEFSEDAAETLTVRVDGTRRFRARVALGASTRRLGPSRDCGDLVDTAAATVAILLDPLGRRPAPPAPEEEAEVPAVGVHGAEVRGEEVVSPPATTSPGPTSPDSSEPTEPAEPIAENEPSPEISQAPTESLRWGPDLFVGTSLGVGPSAFLDARIGLRVGSDHWHIAARARFRHSLVAVSLSVTDAEVIVTSYGGELESCGKWWHLDFCGVVEFSGYGAEGEQTGRGERAPFVTVGPRLGFRWPVTSSLELALVGDLAVLITRPRILLDGRPVWAAGALGGSISAGLSVAFGAP